jgi:hypothetical protein
MKKVAISVLIILSFNIYSQSTEVAKQWLLKNYNHEQNQKNQTKRYNSFLTEYCDYFMNGSQTDENQENKIFAKYGYSNKNIFDDCGYGEFKSQKLIAAEFLKNDQNHLVFKATLKSIDYDGHSSISKYIVKIIKINGKNLIDEIDNAK